MKVLLLLGLLLTNIAFAHEVDKPPELWSWFKDLNKSKASCFTESFLALNQVGLTQITKNEYGFYGTYNNNRIVVKCLSLGANQSKVMVAVAGMKRESVADLRNKVIALIK